MPLFYKVQGYANTKMMGRFFRKIGSNLFRFRPRELQDLSGILLANVQRYVPVRTGVLKSSLMAQADINAIIVVAQASIQLTSEYRKEYAEWVEAGVFGKDESRMIKTPDYGGPHLVMSPAGADMMNEQIDFELMMAVAGQEAQATVNGFAQFMRAGLYDTMPALIQHFRRIIKAKVLSEYRAIS